MIVAWPAYWRSCMNAPLGCIMLCGAQLRLCALVFAADGGKLLCDVSRLPEPCLIYSLGSNGDYSFERDMLNVTK